MAALIGLIFLIVGMVSFFTAFGGGGPPWLFWCCFVGIPLLFVGGVMCMFGFMGGLARYTAAVGEMCDTCEPAGLCFQVDCPLRGVSPLPLAPQS